MSSINIKNIEKSKNPNSILLTSVNNIPSYLQISGTLSYFGTDLTGNVGKHDLSKITYIQSDFNQLDILETSFIKNKPNLIKSLGSPNLPSTKNSIYIELDINGDSIGTYIYDGSNWTPISFNQIQPDWNQSDTSIASFIKNKPALSPVATSGDYSSLLNKPTIPDSQTQSNWGQTNSNSVDFIINKPDLSLYELVANKGVPNGYVPLNSSGLIDSTFLNVSGTEYKGTWNPSTNTPTLSNTTGTNGWFYYIDVDGAIDLGDGVISFQEGNIVIFDNVSNQWKKVGGQQLITNDLGISLSDFTSSVNYYYYGGNTDAGDWQINKWNTSTNIKTIANFINNNTYSSLPTAWVDRLILNYI